MLNDHHCCLLFISRCKFCVNLKMINSVLYIFSCTHWSFMSWLRISLGWEAYIPAAGLFICWGWYTGTVSVQCTVVRSVSASRPGYHHSVTLSRLPWIRSQSSWHIFLWFRNTRSLKDAQIFINKARRINMNINKLHGCEQFFNRIKLHVLYLTTQLLISLSLTLVSHPPLSRCRECSNFIKHHLIHYQSSEETISNDFCAYLMIFTWSNTVFQWSEWKYSIWYINHTDSSLCI